MRPHPTQMSSGQRMRHAARTPRERFNFPRCAGFAGGSTMNTSAHAFLSVLAAHRKVDLPEKDAKLPTTGRRLAFANALTDGRHPLLARVMVNRVWQHHFGTGIVASLRDALLGMDLDDKGRSALALLQLDAVVAGDVALFDGIRARMRDAIERKKDGEYMKKRADLLQELLAERVTGGNVPHYVSTEMKWGLEQEPNAKAEYEEDYGVILRPATFIEHPTIENFGATPDALIGADTVVEIKCPLTTTHIGYCGLKTVPEEYQPQILAQLACTGRTKAKFISYDPRIKGPKRLLVRDWEPDPAEIAAIEIEAREFLAELDRMFDEFTTTEPAA